MAARRATRLLRLGVGAAALGSIPALTHSFTVHAASDQDSERNMVKITELSVYNNPEEGFQYRYVPEEISPLRQVISEARQAVWEYLETIEETTDNLKGKFETGKAHSQGLLDYFQNDPGTLPRAAVITIAGLGGIVAGYRGGVMRKLFFSASGIAAAASLCYPNEAVALTTDLYNTAAENILCLWSGQDSAAETPAAGGDESKGDQPLMEDPGQSREEDKDMYTTRGS